MVMPKRIGVLKTVRCLPSKMQVASFRFRDCPITIDGVVACRVPIFPARVNIVRGVKPRSSNHDDFQELVSLR